MYARTHLKITEKKLFRRTQTKQKKKTNLIINGSYIEVVYDEYDEREHMYDVDHSVVIVFFFRIYINCGRRDATGKTSLLWSFIFNRFKGFYVNYNTERSFIS